MPKQKQPKQKLKSFESLGDHAISGVSAKKLIPKKAKKTDGKKNRGR